MAIKQTQLQQVQLGVESTRGTAVATTIELVGISSFNPKQENMRQVRRRLGGMGQSDAVITKVEGMGTMEGDLNYDQFHLILNSLLGTASATGTGPYVRTYNGQDTTIPTRAFYTLQKGDGSDAYGLLGSVASSLEITIANGEWVTYTVDWIGYNMATDTLDAVSPPSSVTYALPHHCTVSIGAIGGALTALNCDVKSGTITINTNTTNTHGLGSLVPCDFRIGEIEVKASVVVDVTNSTVKTAVESTLGTTGALLKREIRFNITDGTANNILLIDVSAYLESDPEFYTDEDGMATWELEFDHIKDEASNLTSYLDISLTNGTA